MNKIPFNAEVQRTRRSAERQNCNQRSADSLVRVVLARRSGLADKAVRAPGKCPPLREPLRSLRFYVSIASFFSKPS